MNLREPQSGLRTSQQIAWRWLREFVSADWWLKLLALAIATGLWFAVTEQRSPAAIRLRGIKLAFLLPEEMELSNVSRDEADLTLEGSRVALDQINVRDLVATVDLKGKSPGERVVRLAPESMMMDLPEGVRVKRVEPTQVALRIEPRVEREVEVEPRLEGSLPAGYALKAVFVTPRVVRVRGPLSSVNELAFAATETIALQDLKESFVDFRVAIDIPDQKVMALESLVTVRIEIEAQKSERTIAGVKLYASPEHAAREEHQLVGAVVYGPQLLIERLDAKDLSIIMKRKTAAKRHSPVCSFRLGRSSSSSRA
ncbi:MAG: CdaR family protein [Pyrinomonadaceae bacterium]